MANDRYWEKTGNGPYVDNEAKRAVSAPAQAAAQVAQVAQDGENLGADAARPGYVGWAVLWKHKQGVMHVTSDISAAAAFRELGHGVRALVYAEFAQSTNPQPAPAALVREPLSDEQARALIDRHARRRHPDSYSALLALAQDIQQEAAASWGITLAPPKEGE